uniref:Uncharacterized protein n=1 Tax=Glossina austeni TaxID=7395 RepID=A0A1A9V7I8_GLOAU
MELDMLQKLRRLTAIPCWFTLAMRFNIFIKIELEGFPKIACFMALSETLPEIYLDVITSEGLNHRQSIKFVEEVERDFMDIPIHAEIRWLHIYKVLKRFRNFMDEILDVLNIKNKLEEFADLKDEQGLNNFFLLLDMPPYLRHVYKCHLVDDKIKVIFATTSNETLSDFATKGKELKTRDVSLPPPFIHLELIRFAEKAIWKFYGSLHQIFFAK